MGMATEGDVRGARAADKVRRRLLARLSDAPRAGGPCVYYLGAARATPAGARRPRETPQPLLTDETQKSGAEGATEPTEFFWETETPRAPAAKRRRPALPAEATVTIDGRRRPVLRVLHEWLVGAPGAAAAAPYRVERACADAACVNPFHANVVLLSVATATATATEPADGGEGGCAAAKRARHERGPPLLRAQVLELLRFAEDMRLEGDASGRRTTLAEYCRQRGISYWAAHNAVSGRGEYRTQALARPLGTVARNAVRAAEKRRIAAVRRHRAALAAASAVPETSAN